MVFNTTILVDDQSSSINYLCPSTKQTVTGAYYNNTWTTIGSPLCGSNGWFEHTFNGTGVRIFVSFPEQNQAYSVKIDDNPLTSLSGNGYFESSLLSDGQHTVTYAFGDLEVVPTFDYLAVTAGPSTPLDGKTLVIDDMDDALTYSGSWSTSSPLPLRSFDYSTSLFQNTVHWSTAVGDTIELQFTGTSISVFGIVAGNMTSGNISTTYTINHVPFSTPIPTGTLVGLPNMKLFHADIEAGNHTLLINVTEVPPSQAIGFDFITYNVSIPDVTSSGDAQPTVTGLAASPQQIHNSFTGAIAGGAIGGVILLLALIIGFVMSKQGHKGKWKGGGAENSAADPPGDIKSKKRNPPSITLQADI